MAQLPGYPTDIDRQPDREEREAEWFRGSWNEEASVLM